VPAPVRHLSALLGSTGYDERGCWATFRLDEAYWPAWALHPSDILIVRRALSTNASGR